MKTVRLTMAQALLKFLDKQYLSVNGVEKKFVRGIFGIFGHGNVAGLGEAIVESKHDLCFYQGHNEQGMAHAAIAYAKQQRRQEIFAVTSSVGPGATNMVTAAATASANRIPVLFLPGDVFVSRQPDPVLQQIENSYNLNITANDAFRPVSRYWDRISRPEQLIAACMNAMRVLTDPAETGAVTLCLPQDTQGEAWNYPAEFLEKKVHYLYRQSPAPEAVAAAAELLRKKKHPLIICGGGVNYADAGRELAAFAEAHAIPIGETQAGKGQIPWSHPCNLGGIGVTGTGASNELAQKADLIFSVGCRMGDFTTASKWLFKNPECSIISMNTNAYDAAKLGALALRGDVFCCLKDLQTALGSYTSSWGSEIARVKQEWNDEVERLYTEQDSAELSQTRVLGELNENLLPKDAVIVAASGSIPGDLQRLWRCREAGGYHMEYAYSCMGYEVSGALGVKLAVPDKEIFALVGDGAYMMLHSELLTCMREGVKITVLLFDNGGFQCIDNLQTSQGITSYGNIWHARGNKSKKLDAPMRPVDYAQNAASYGLEGYTVRSISELRTAFAKAAACEHSVLIDIKVGQKSMTGSYKAWWRVGTPQLSASEAVHYKHMSMQEEVSKSRQY